MYETGAPKYTPAALYLGEWFLDIVWVVAYPEVRILWSPCQSVDCRCFV